MNNLTSPLAVAAVIMSVHSNYMSAADKPSGDPSIVPAGATLEELWAEGEFTEGVAVAANGMVYFSDIQFASAGNGRIMKFNPVNGAVTVHCANSRQSNGLMFDRSGRLLAACGAANGAMALCEITANGNAKVLVDRYKGKRLNAPNDLVVHPNGSVYFSDPRYVGEEPMELDHMSVFRYSPDGGSLARMMIDIQKPNGLHVSPDGKTLYVAETNNGSTDVTKQDPNTKIGRMTLNAFSIAADGSLTNKRVLADFGDETGTDGMSIDSKGNIYAAVRAASRHGIVVFSPEGKEKAYIPTDELPTNCCFGVGGDARTLYVTAGKGLYRIRLGISGFHPARAE